MHDAKSAKTDKPGALYRARSQQNDAKTSKSSQDNRQVVVPGGVQVLRRCIGLRERDGPEA